MTAEQVDWLRLHLTPGLGRAGLLRLQRAFGDAESILAAGPDALHAGAAPAVLQRLARALGRGRLAVPLAVTADLTARGVPADSAATLTLARARSTSDADLLALERDVERDIALGANPLTATAGRFTGDSPTAVGLDAGVPGPGLPGTTQQTPKPRKP